MLGNARCLPSSSTQRNALRRGLENPVDVRERIRHNQQMASALLRKEGFSARQIEVLWQRFKADYFLRHTHTQIAWHCAHLLRMDDPNKPLVLISKGYARWNRSVRLHQKINQRCLLPWWRSSTVVTLTFMTHKS